jgi:thiamine pyrophosphokinase
MFDFEQFFKQFNEVTLVYSGGEVPNTESLKKIINFGHFHIAADHGVHICNTLGIKPDVLLGDMDSIKNLDSFMNQEIKIIPFPKNKDFTDTELAINYASTMHKDSVVLIGGGGNQLDHFLANIQLVIRNPIIKLWITAREIIIPVHDVLFIKNAQNLRSSIYSDKDAIVSTSGLQWELQNYLIHSTKMSVSNCCLENLIKITVSKGSALILLYPDFINPSNLDFTYV